MLRALIEYLEVNRVDARNLVIDDSMTSLEYSVTQIVRAMLVHADSLNQSLDYQWGKYSWNVMTPEPWQPASGTSFLIERAKWINTMASMRPNVRIMGIYVGNNTHIR